MNRTIILRCHTEIAEECGRSGTEQLNRPKLHHKPRRSGRHWPPFALVFDCETRLDERQSLTFGFARLLQDDGTGYGECRVEIIFYDPDELTSVEIHRLKEYAGRRRAEVAKDVGSRDIVVCTKQYFIEKLLFPHIEAAR